MSRVNVYSKRKKYVVRSEIEIHIYVTIVNLRIQYLLFKITYIILNMYL